MVLDPSTARDGSDHAAVPPDQWADALLRARRPGAVRPVFQPIVDLRRGVVCGYEMLARFVGPPEASPDVWFRRAGEHGMAIELEAKMVKVGLEARESLPDNCFLTINLDPASLPDPQVQAALAHHKRLHGVVIELTENSRADADEILERLAEIRSRGAMIAIDDVGSGYSGLLQIGVLRPEFMKIDRSLIAGLQDDPAKQEMVESLGAVANRTDAWVVAEGIEGTAELETLMGIGVPLGQGWALGRPEPAMTGPEVELSAYIRQHSRPDEDEQPPRLWRDLAPLYLDRWKIDVGRRLREDPDTDHLPVTDDRGRPVGIVSRARHRSGNGELVSPLCALDGEDAAALARRAMARPRESRFDPVICCDDTGRYLGPIEIERLIEVLAAKRPIQPPPARGA
jgi:EAL domain-containing protein (putative c-di-GMP-specific phosphodiesterase class I)